MARGAKEEEKLLSTSRKLSSAEKFFLLFHSALQQYRESLLSVVPIRIKSILGTVRRWNREGREKIDYTEM